MSIINEWEIKTRAVVPRSAELKKVDAAVKTWATQGQGAQDINMKNTWTLFSAWKAAKVTEYNRIKVAADQLQDALADKWDKKGQMAGVGASGVKPIGWKLVAYDPTKHGGTLLPAAQHVPEMTPAEISKINEAMRRVKSAIEGARDAMIIVNKRKAFTRPMQVEEQAYVDFFGAYDATRFSRVLTNFQVLALAFAKTPEFIDVRNRTQWATTYGGCVRKNLAIKKDGSLALSGTVNMLVGRSFLGSGSYEKTTDDTIATLVHEFSHGSLNAVDVPNLDAHGVFKCTRQSDDATNADFGNSTDPFRFQCGSEADDRALALHKPEYALVNADSYGQFTKCLLLENRG